MHMYWVPSLTHTPYIFGIKDTNWMAYSTAATTSRGSRIPSGGKSSIALSWDQTPKEKTTTPSGETNDASLDRKMPAKKMDGSDNCSDDDSDDDTSKPSTMTTDDAGSNMKTPAKRSPKRKSISICGCIL